MEKIEDQAPKEHKKNWREVYASVDEIKDFLANRIFLRHNVITRRVEYRLASSFTQDFMPYIIYEMIYEMAYSFALWSAGRKRSPVWGYLFDRIPPGDRYKAYHACDLWYMFGNMDKSWRPFGEEDFKLRDEMVQYVSNFVYYGNPNGGGLPYWPSLSFRRRQFRYFGDDERRLIGPVRSRNKEWKTFFRDKGPM